MQTLARPSLGRRRATTTPPTTGRTLQGARECVGVRCVSPCKQMTTIAVSGNTVLPPPAFVRLLNRFFARLGYFVADNDRLVIIVSFPSFTFLFSSRTFHLSITFPFPFNERHFLDLCAASDQLPPFLSVRRFSFPLTSLIGH